MPRQTVQECQEPDWSRDPNYNYHHDLMQDAFFPLFRVDGSCRQCVTVSETSGVTPQIRPAYPSFAPSSPNASSFGTPIEKCCWTSRQLPFSRTNTDVCRHSMAVSPTRIRGRSATHPTS